MEFVVIFIIILLVVFDIILIVAILNVNGAIAQKDSTENVICPSFYCPPLTDQSGSPIYDKDGKQMLGSPCLAGDSAAPAAVAYRWADTSKTTVQCQGFTVAYNWIGPPAYYNTPVYAYLETTPIPQFV